MSFILQISLFVKVLNINYSARAYYIGIPILTSLSQALSSKSMHTSVQFIIIVHMSYILLLQFYYMVVQFKVNRFIQILITHVLNLPQSKVSIEK